MEKILLLGGTHFIGRNLVEQLLASQKYELTLCNRGQTNSQLFPHLRKIKTDRNKDDLSSVLKENWDYIIDLSCYYPNSLENICRSVKANLKRYIFISTCSVYNNDINKEILRDETAPILNCSIEQRTNEEPSSYGNRKAECERILTSSGIPHTILRPALVYGQYDSTDRFYYWLYQVKKNQQLLLPEEGKGRFSTTYVMDLVNGILSSMHEERPSSVYNIISTPETSILKIVQTAQKILQRNIKLLNATTEFLHTNEIAQWLDMPLWLEGNHFTYNNQLSKDQISFNPTPFEVSVQACISYYNQLNWHEPAFGISEIKRKELIQGL